MVQSKNFLMQLHPMRLALYLCVVVSILLRPGIDSELVFEGWAIVSALLVPVLVPIFFMLLMLDAIMSRVWLSEAINSEAINSEAINSEASKSEVSGTEVGRLKMITRTDLVLGVLLLVYWIPFYISLS